MKPLDKPIRSLDDLTRVWRLIDGGHGYSAPQLFALLIDADGLILPGIVQVYDDGIAAGPDDEYLSALVEQLGAALDEFAPGGSVAIMKARPGSPSMTSADRRWVRGLHEHFDKAPFAFRPLFFATDSSLGLVPPDELVAAAS